MLATLSKLVEAFISAPGRAALRVVAVMAVVVAPFMAHPSVTGLADLFRNLTRRAHRFLAYLDDHIAGAQALFRRGAVGLYVLLF